MLVFRRLQFFTRKPTTKIFPDFATSSQLDVSTVKLPQGCAFSHVGPAISNSPLLIFLRNCCAIQTPLKLCSISLLLSMLQIGMHFTTTATSNNTELHFYQNKLTQLSSMQHGLSELDRSTVIKPHLNTTFPFPVT